MSSKNPASPKSFTNIARLLQAGLAGALLAVSAYRETVQSHPICTSTRLAFLFIQLSHPCPSTDNHLSVIVRFRNTPDASFDPDAGQPAVQLILLLTASSLTIISTIFFLTPFSLYHFPIGNIGVGRCVTALFLEVACWLLWLGSMASIAVVLEWNASGYPIALLTLSILEL